MKLDRAERVCWLGVECGATHSVALLVDGVENVLSRLELGPGNIRLMSDVQLVRHFKVLKGWHPSAVGIGMAGARTEADRRRIEVAAAKVWPGVPCSATHDLDTALESGVGMGGEGRARVLILSGTGSCCFGRGAGGETAKIGGWGHLLGDKGSGYEIGLRSVKAVLYYHDRDGGWSALGRRILRVLGLNEPDDLIEWAQGAAKGEVASLAKEVFAAWKKKDRIAADILTGAESSLAKDGLACAARLVKEGEAVEFVLAGGVLVHQPRFAEGVERRLREKRAGALVTVQEREGAWGAVRLARRRWEQEGKPLGRRKPVDLGRVGAGRLEGLAKSPTERRNLRSMKLDRMTVREGIRLMLSEEAKVCRALMKVEAELEWMVKRVVRSLAGGGSLYYVGAGTSGRLGVLDASECPPTFRTLPEQVQGIIAGGRRALWQSVEGAEDDPGAGVRAVMYRGVKRGDMVVGIAASGRTPFVLGALKEAKRLGAASVLLCFNPMMELGRGERPDRVVAVDVGPEVLTGSTRLKAGTATKVILNTLTTLAMVRLGKVKENLMIDVAASNAKLRDRAVRIVRELTGADEEGAKAALRKARWGVKEALVLVRRKASR